MNLHSCERNNAWKTQKLGGRKREGEEEERGGKNDGSSGQKLSGGETVEEQWWIGGWKRSKGERILFVT